MFKIKKLFFIPVIALGMLFWLYPATSLALVSGTFLKTDSANLLCSLPDENFVIVFNTLPPPTDQEINEIPCNILDQAWIDNVGSAGVFDLVEASQTDASLCAGLPQPRVKNDCLSIITPIAQSQVIILEKTSYLTTGDSATFFDIAKELFSNLWQIIALSFGIPLAFYATREIIALASRWGR